MIEWRVLFLSYDRKEPTCVDCFIGDKRITLHYSLHTWILNYGSDFNGYDLEVSDLESAKEESINLIETSLQSALKDIQEYRNQNNKQKKEDKE